jgi:hypothetical protein
MGTDPRTRSDAPNEYKTMAVDVHFLHLFDQDFHLAISRLEADPQIGEHAAQKLVLSWSTLYTHAGYTCTFRLLP